MPNLFSRARRPVEVEPDTPTLAPTPVVRDHVSHTTYNADGTVTVYKFDPAAPEGERETTTVLNAEEARRQDPHVNATPTADLLAVETALRR